MRYVEWFVVAALCIIAAFVVHVVRQAREAARAASCEGHMNQLQGALRKYEIANGHFPPAYIVGPDGKPWHSWRVLILPYVEHQDVYAKYRFDEPWNGPHNRQLADQIHVELFQCCSGPEYENTLNTNYVAVVGKGTAFPDAGTTKLGDFSDGLENTILLVEVANSGIHWMEPRDLELDSLTIGPSTPVAPAVSSPHPRGPGVVFADGITCYRMKKPLIIQTMRGLLTVAGGESVLRESLDQWDDGRTLVEEGATVEVVGDKTELR